MGKIAQGKQFITEARQELKKVTWPTKQQTMNATWVVIAVTVLLSVFMGLVDMGLSRLVGLIAR